MTPSCSRGTRFGVPFNNDLYGKRVTSAWFNAGIRVTDIRDPYNPKEVAYLVYPINANTQPSNSTINGVTYSQLDVSCDNTEVDDDNYIYCRAANRTQQGGARRNGLFRSEPLAPTARGATVSGRAALRPCHACEAPGPGAHVPRSSAA